MSFIKYETISTKSFAFLIVTLWFSLTRNFRYMGKYGPKKTRIQEYFTQWKSYWNKATIFVSVLMRRLEAHLVPCQISVIGLLSTSRY